jgi:hypothetical protein
VSISHVVKTAGAKILHILESLVLALFLTFGTCMLIMFVIMLFVQGPGDSETTMAIMFTMPFYPIIFVSAIGVSCEPVVGRRLVRIASVVLLGLLLCVIVASWIKNWASA